MPGVGEAIPRPKWRRSTCTEGPWQIRRRSPRALRRTRPPDSWPSLVDSRSPSNLAQGTEGVGSSILEISLPMGQREPGRSAEFLSPYQTKRGQEPEPGERPSRRSAGVSTVDGPAQVSGGGDVIGRRRHEQALPGSTINGQASSLIMAGSPCGRAKSGRSPGVDLWVTPTHRLLRPDEEGFTRPDGTSQAHPHPVERGHRTCP